MNSSSPHHLSSSYENAFEQAAVGPTTPELFGHSRIFSPAMMHFKWVPSNDPPWTYFCQYSRFFLGPCTSSRQPHTHVLDFQRTSICIVANPAAAVSRLTDDDSAFRRLLNLAPRAHVLVYSWRRDHIQSLTGSCSGAASKFSPMSRRCNRPTAMDLLRTKHATKACQVRRLRRWSSLSYVIFHTKNGRPSLNGASSPPLCSCSKIQDRPPSHPGPGTN